MDEDNNERVSNRLAAQTFMPIEPAHVNELSDMAAEGYGDYLDQLEDVT